MIWKIDYIISRVTSCSSIIIKILICKYPMSAFAYCVTRYYNWFKTISSDFQHIMYFISLINKLCILNVIYFHNKYAVQNKL